MKLVTRRSRPALAWLRPVVADLFDLHLYTQSLALEMRERVLGPDGNVIEDTGWWEPNALTNEGQASMLNVYFRELTNVDKYLLLLNMTGGGVPTVTTTMGTMTESTTPGTDGYDRQQLIAGDWSAPALSSGNEQTTNVEKTFGPFTDDVPVSHVALATVATGTGGLLLLYVPTAYFTDTGNARTYLVGESYLPTLRDKQI